MRRMIKRMTAAAVASGLAVSLSMTALAEEIGPGFETPAAEIIDGPRFPGDTEYMNEEPENGSQAGESSGQEGQTGDGTAPAGQGDGQTSEQPAEEPAGPVAEQPSQEQTGGSVPVPDGGTGAVQYPEGMVPNTVLNGGNVDITPTNEGAIWDAVEVTGMHANLPTQFTWISAKLKDGYSGKLSYRPYVNNGGWLQFYSDGQPGGGTEGSTYVEAIQMHLTGDAAEKYDLYYAVTTANRGQLGFAAEGEIAGAMNVGDSIVDLKVVLVPKGSGAPASTADRYFNEFSGRIGFTDTAAFCVNTDGTPYTGWADYDGRRYYFENGHTLSGWRYIDGLKFYFEENGQLRQDVDSLIGKQDEYELHVNKQLNCLTVYAKDGDNGFIIPVKAMLTSVGDDTPLGTFHTPEKYRWRFMVNDTYTQYATRITKGFLFHSITYETTNPNTMITNGYNGLGVVRSAGCVRLTCENAKWIYDNCKIGTTVVIYEDPNVPSPFMKPYVVLIPDDQTYDPSDPNIG